MSDAGYGRLQDKTALITGSGQNIGRAIAELLAAEGASVVVNGATGDEQVQAVVESIRNAGGKATGVMADVGNPQDVQRLVSEAEQVFGAVDIVVNNVGRRLKVPFEDITIEVWRDTLNTNLNSVFYMAHYCLPGMRERGWGRVINISGYDGFTGHFPQRAANVTAKAGMHGLSKAIAREYGKDNITCNTVVPGAIQTVRDVSQYSHVNVERVLEMLATPSPGESLDIAEACLYLAADSGKFATGFADGCGNSHQLIFAGIDGGRGYTRQCALVHQSG